ncbi:hypothetical protein COJ85_01060 [Bacillus sp. AFS076308]|uniref:hypothetical protein n=1 Tax=Bacillus sp. AFS076308 TaxID=2033512 RepID=UPI000BF45F3C|nr:hypothetical protein [Bacillus sp. AFS076308]PFO09748.1 hypothetical protein COJ85_01060 [Bacillus sp. AFS076308]
MKGKWLLIIILVVVFSGGRIAFADGDHGKVPSTSSLNGQSEHDMEGMDISGDNSNSHQTKSVSSDHNSSNGDDMEGMTEGEVMDMEGSGGHSHEPVKEEPANLKVLGTFGAVNLSFIVIGVWNKWFRRKDGSSGNSKRQVI